MPDATPDAPTDTRWPAANLLAHETSPYLLQHGANPVHWRPWGQTALDEAAALDRPILLSVGYAACHWCHVMAHESFEDAATAALMNELFVNIKVDREERPDVDQIYMAALHALGEQGGWPLTMFLTPRGEPFWGGTYFPPRSRYGRPGFADVLRGVAAVFRDKPDQVAHNRDALLAHLGRVPERGQGDLGQSGFGRRALDAATTRLAGMMDAVNGGPLGAPKFPNASLLLLLWRGGERMRDPALTGLVTHTLERICRGGIRDHLGGGFARYSVDERWLVPHFEKMLYDNAQLLDLLALVHASTGEALFERAADELVGWLAREMMAGDGRAFASSLDADSEGEEGRFYVWTPAEVEAALGPEEAALVGRFYDITRQGNFDGASIPNRLDGPEPTAGEAVRLDAALARLLEARAARVRPGRDDKVLADWNGLTIAALARAGRHFGRPDWISLGEGAFAFVAEAMQRHGRLGHSWREGALVFPGLASDHAAMTGAALALHEATGTAAYLDAARGWADALERHHSDPETGGWFWTADDAGALILRPRSALDEAVPGAAGLMAEALLRLAAATGEASYRERADAALTELAPQMADNVFGHASLLGALDLRLAGAEIVVTGPEGDAGAAALVEAAEAMPWPLRTVLRVPAPEALPEGHPARGKGGEGARAYVCVGEQCSLPVTRPEAIAAARLAVLPG